MPHIRALGSRPALHDVHGFRRGRLAGACGESISLMSCDHRKDPAITTGGVWHVDRSHAGQPQTRRITRCRRGVRLMAMSSGGSRNSGDSEREPDAGAWKPGAAAAAAASVYRGHGHSANEHQVLETRPAITASNLMDRGVIGRRKLWEVSRSLRTVRASDAVDISGILTYLVPGSNCECRWGQMVDAGLIGEQGFRDRAVHP
ncbi:hypothetical protein AXG93_3943s1340 [Marchantia polymorpha subsp. ruderalis]|uniref:Uncharacterized protein n=1 Tax=Marchantia polymorpha subsp. ruderalis TaxID=1480154 RepID=A0A176WE35_MARPO|nr:hypothetical protein AXG93_3943s1340 [Marchantia polymorpha subsp. ruderalis]